MTARRIAPGLCLVVAVLAGGHGPRAADPPGPAAWTYDEAIAKLALSPRDPYLQYVALVLAGRENRDEQEVIRVVERPAGGFFAPREDGGRRARADLFSTFTGALAIQESLQLDTLRGDRRENREQRPADPAARPAGPVAVSTLVGPTVKSHPWEKMLAGKTPETGPLADCVPDDFYFAEFRSVAKLNEVLALGDQWGGHVFAQALGDATAPLTADRVRRQLGLLNLPPQAADALGVEAVGVAGSDLFLAEGSDVTVLVLGKNVPAVLRLIEGVGKQAGTSEKGEHAGVAYTYRADPAAGLNVYTANPRPDLHVRGNSLPAFKRVLEAVAGKTADGKPVRRLGESAEFRYVRTLLPRAAAEEDGIVYLSDPFIRRLVGPQVKLTERRRVLVYNHLRMIGHACLLFRTEHGRPPKSLEELAETKCAPGVFGKGDLAHPDGATYSLAADGMSGVCSKYGRADALTPCIERPVTEVTAEEAAEYRQFVTDYSEYWRTFFDPIVVRVKLTDKQVRLETLILPLIDNSIYTAMAAATAGKAIPLDPLPTPGRELGGLWVHFDKKLLLDALGPEQAAKKPAAPARRPAVPRVTVQNELKQIGLAFHNYHDAYTHLPLPATVDAAGKPLLSWRVAILPFVEQDNLYREFKLDEPWDSEHNKKLIAKMPKLYAGGNKKRLEEGKTTYLLPVGKDTLFPPGKKVKFADVTDGTSNTIMAVDAAGDRAVIWTKPDDLPVDPKQPLRGLAAAGRPAFDVILGDGSTREIRTDIDPAELAKAFHPSDGQVHNLDGAAQPRGRPDQPAPADDRPKAAGEVANDLTQIALGMHNYESTFGFLPTGNVRDKDGKPLLSWRVAILPFIEQDNLYRQFKTDEPWDSEHNKKLVAQMPRIFRGADAKLNAAGKTTYVVPAGKGTISPPDAAKPRLVGITDGSANTILATVAAGDHAVIWTKPDDLAIDFTTPTRGLIWPGREFFPAAMCDGSVRQFSGSIDPKKLTALFTTAGGEVIELAPGDEGPRPARAQDQPGGGREFFLPEWKPAPADLEELEKYGVDLNVLRRFLRDGIGDQVGLHMHDAPKLFDYETAGAVGGGIGGGLGLSGPAAFGLGMLIQFLTGPSSISVPVKDAKAVDDFLDALDALILARRQDAENLGARWGRDVDFYRVPFPEPHKIRCASVRFAGLKWRVFWGRIGTGLYAANRPFILEDLAAANAAGGRPAKPSDPANALLRVRPENWKTVLPGYNLGWAEGQRVACLDNLSRVASVSRGWNDRRPAGGKPDAELLDRVVRVYGARPVCPDGGTYTLSADGKACRCSVHGDPLDPRQPAAPAPASPAGRFAATFAGLSATLRFEDDGLRAVVVIERK